MPHEHFQECIEACQRCATICNHCAIACTQENEVSELAGCIQLDLECAAICTTAAQVMSMNGLMSEQLCQLCAEIFNRCADECSKHRHMEHCRKCEVACRNCAEVCMHMGEHA